MKKCIFENNLKSVYVDGNYAMKVFAKDYHKTDVLYEALNTSRVEDAGVSIPKLVSVSVEDGQWVITSEYAQGITLAALMEQHPEHMNEYIDKLVEYQIDFQSKTNPLLLKLNDKLARQISSLTDLDSSIRYELETRLESMPKHTKLCHGDYSPENIIVTTDDNNMITTITAVDWVHATQGNASADVANTYLLIKLRNSDAADLYLNRFCEATNTSKDYVTKWLPIVAAARLTKKKPEEKDLLEQWIDVVDFQ